MRAVSLAASVLSVPLDTLGRARTDWRVNVHQSTEAGENRAPISSPGVLRLPPTASFLCNRDASYGDLAISLSETINVESA